MFGGSAVQLQANRTHNPRIRTGGVVLTAVGFDFSLSHQEANASRFGELVSGCSVRAPVASWIDSFLIIVDRMNNSFRAAAVAAYRPHALAKLGQQSCLRQRRNGAMIDHNNAMLEFFPKP